MVVGGCMDRAEPAAGAGESESTESQGGRKGCSGAGSTSSPCKWNLDGGRRELVSRERDDGNWQARKVAWTPRSTSSSSILACCAFSRARIHLATWGWGFGLLAFSFKQNQPAAFKMALLFPVALRPTSRVNLICKKKG